MISKKLIRGASRVAGVGSETWIDVRRRFFTIDIDFFFLIELHKPVIYYNFHQNLLPVHCLLLELTLSWLSRQVKSKTVAQCVEYYYTWKKITRLGRKHRTRLTETIDDCVVSEATELSHILAPLPPHTQVSKWLVFGLAVLPRWPQ